MSLKDRFEDPAFRRRAGIVLLVALLTWWCWIPLLLVVLTLVLSAFVLYVAVKWILFPFGRWIRSVWTRVRTIPDFRDGFRNGIATTLIVGLLLVCFGGAGSVVQGVQKWITSLTEAVPKSSLAAAALSGDAFNGCDADCQAKIKARRAKIVGIEENELSYVQAELRREYANPANAVWYTTRVQTCVANYLIFEKANQYTMYPAALVAGKAYVESAGCVFAKTRDGGKGPMQITTPEPWHEKAVAAMIHEDKSWVHKAWRGESGDPNWDYWVNVLMGTVMLSGYEEEFDSRGVGIFAYNSGAGATRKYMKKMGITSFKNHQISQFRGVIPEGFGDGSRPRIYLDRILAGAVMVDRAHRGLSVVDDGSWIDRLTLQDIPGYDPRLDAVQ